MRFVSTDHLGHVLLTSMIIHPLARQRLHREPSVSSPTFICPTRIQSSVRSSAQSSLSLLPTLIGPLKRALEWVLLVLFLVAEASNRKVTLGANQTPPIRRVSNNARASIQFLTVYQINWTPRTGSLVRLVISVAFMIVV